MKWISNHMVACARNMTIIPDLFPEPNRHQLSPDLLPSLYWSNSLYLLATCNKLPTSRHYLFLKKIAPCSICFNGYSLHLDLKYITVKKRFWMVWSFPTCTSLVLFHKQIFFLMVLVTGQYWPHIMSWEVFSPHIFWKALRRININSFLNVW